MARSLRNPRAGISLLEIMVVLAIIALVVALAAPRVIQNFGRAKSQAAEIQLNSLKGALQLYYIDVGRYPSEGEGLLALLQAPGGAADWQGPYLEDSKDMKDPWGRDILYKYPSTNGGFELRTLGRDGQPGGNKEDRDISL